MHKRLNDHMNNIILDHTRKICIIGAGGLGKEVFCCIREQNGWQNHAEIKFLEENSFYKKRKVLGVDVLPLSETEIKDSLVVIAIGEAQPRERIAALLPHDTEFAIVVGRGVSLTPYTKLGRGTIVLGQSFLSCDVEIGNHSIINPGTTISHDCKIGDFFTASPGVNVSGNCNLGKHVFLGTNSCIRNAIRICDNVIIGMGAVVTKDITIGGMYIGNPARWNTGDG